MGYHLYHLFGSPIIFAILSFSSLNHCKDPSADILNFLSRFSPFSPLFSPVIFAELDEFFIGPSAIR